MNLDDWASRAYANGMDERLIAFLCFKPELLFAVGAARTLAEGNGVSEPALVGIHPPYPAKIWRQPAVAGWGIDRLCRPGGGCGVCPFIDSLERFDAITEGREADVPVEIDLQYAAAAALAGRALRVKGKPEARQCGVTSSTMPSARRSRKWV